jgi:hypothetical protein
VPFPYQELSRQEQYRERIGEELMRTALQVQYSMHYAQYTIHHTLMRTALQVQSIVYPQYYPY